MCFYMVNSSIIIHGYHLTTMIVPFYIEDPVDGGGGDTG